MMNIEGIQGWQALPVQWDKPLTEQTPEVKGSFKQILIDGLNEVNNKQIDANAEVKAFLAGEGPALHEVMLRAEEANLSLEFAVQIRNKMLEAYQEIMRMQM